MAIGIPIIGSRDPIARIGDRRPPFLRLISALGSAGEVSRRQDVAVRGFAMAMIDCPDAESRMGGNAAAVT
ncbi:MAG: hypothetical protein IT184_03690 [Acidobacteria bacterium]|nr:hypothetical protein [Acidobacteriota bacterium]